MNDILKLVKNLKSNKRNLYIVVIAVGLAILLVVAELISAMENVTAVTADEYTSSAEYIEKTSKELEKILEQVDGAGKVQVMLTLESCYENIYAKTYESDRQQTENETDEKLKEEYVTIKKGSSTEECVVVKVYEPKVKGVAVVCEGGSNTHVKKAITETVCALFDISTAKVSVTKMNIR